MKRYLIFAGLEYYPAGGWEDYIGDSETVEKAMEKLLNHEDMFDWWHIVDSHTMKIVKGSTNV